MGAWIEIRIQYCSHLSNSVAPLVGAWIEIEYSGLYWLGLPNVAPLVGAWIEIMMAKSEKGEQASLPSWERGLKYHQNRHNTFPSLVAPLVGAWIEINGI